MKKLTLSDYQALAEFRYQLRQFLHFSEQAARRAGMSPLSINLCWLLRGCPRECVRASANSQPDCRSSTTVLSSWSIGWRQGDLCPGSERQATAAKFSGRSLRKGSAFSPNSPCTTMSSCKARLHLWSTLSAVLCERIGKLLDERREQQQLKRSAMAYRTLQVRVTAHALRLKLIRRQNRDVYDRGNSKK